MAPASPATAGTGPRHPPRNTNVPGSQPRLPDAGFSLNHNKGSSMNKLILTSMIAIALSAGQANAFGLGDLGGIAKSAVGGAKADAAGKPSVSAGDLDSFLATAKEADGLITASTDTLFKTMVPQKDVAAHNAKVLEANNIADPAKRAEMLQQLVAEQMARLSKVDWDKQSRETPKLLSAEQKAAMKAGPFCVTVHNPRNVYYEMGKYGLKWVASVTKLYGQEIINHWSVYSRE